MPAENRPKNWIHQFARHKPKPPNYAEKTLAAYRLGMKAKGSIRGVRVLVAEDSCPACRALAEAEYTPDNAPILPLAECRHPSGCRCAYTPVMAEHESLRSLIRATNHQTSDSADSARAARD
jgi:hypothetical protein